MPRKSAFLNRAACLSTNPACWRWCNPTAPRNVGRHMTDYKVIVDKSTVPVGTLSAPQLLSGGMAVRDQANLSALTEDVIKTSEIEGVVEMVLEATANCNAPVTRERLFRWHAALFPTGFSGLTPINVGGWRDDAAGPMQVVSGPLGHQRVHFKAPPAKRLEPEAARFLAWANSASNEPPLIKAGLAHLWFVTLHPFDDGNGRMARAVGDLFLARAQASPWRFRQRWAAPGSAGMNERQVGRDRQVFARHRPARHHRSTGPWRAAEIRRRWTQHQLRAQRPIEAGLPLRELSPAPRLRIPRPKPG